MRPGGERVSETILVMGVGNPLMRDEGVGNVVIQRLEAEYRFPDRVRLMDAGTMGMGILNVFRGVDYVIVVDAVRDTGEGPGTVVLMSPEEIAPNQVMHSLHDARLADVLQAAELIGLQPEADFVGVEVASIEQMVPGLTPVVEASVPAAIEAVLMLLERRGVRPEAAEKD